MGISVLLSPIRTLFEARSHSAAADETWGTELSSKIKMWATRPKVWREDRAAHPNGKYATALAISAILALASGSRYKSARQN